MKLTTIIETTSLRLNVINFVDQLEQLPNVIKVGHVKSQSNEYLIPCLAKSSASDAPMSLLVRFYDLGVGDECEIFELRSGKLVMPSGDFKIWSSSISDLTPDELIEMLGNMSFKQIYDLHKRHLVTFDDSTKWFGKIKAADKALLWINS